MKAVPQRYMIDANVWIDYWSKSEPLFLQVLEKSIFSNDKLLQRLLGSSCGIDGLYAGESGLKIMLSAHHGDVVEQPAQFTTIPSEYLAFQYRCEITDKVEQVLNCLHQFPQLIGELVQFLDLGKKRGSGAVSRRAFIRQHLMAVPQFRVLWEMMESEISSLWQILREIIERATTWLWKRCLKFDSELRNASVYLFFVKHFKSEKQKLWPLLLAFKNA